MIYKFIDDPENGYLEVSKEAEFINIQSFDEDNVYLSGHLLDEHQLYKLIGALNEIQKDIRKEAQDGKG